MHNGTQEADGREDGTKLPTATLASIASVEENRLLFDSMLLGRDLWIGLYRDVAEAESPAPQAHGWRWVNAPRAAKSLDDPASGLTSSSATAPGAASASAFTNWHVGEPDAHYGREECAFISGSTGEWGDYGCGLAEMRCLCESGAAATAAYVQFSHELADATEAAKKRQRRWATLVVSLLACIALPLTSAMSDPTAAAARSQRYAIYVGLALFVGGFAPCVAHNMFGSWTAMQLGTWSNYMPFGALGGFILIDALPNTSRHQRLLAVFVGCIFWMICATCAASAVYFAKSARSQESCLAWALSAVNAVGACNLCHMGTQSATISNAKLNQRINRLGRGVTGFSVLLLLLHFGWVGLQVEPDSMWQHPYSPGHAATALSFLTIAIFGGQDTVSKRWQQYKKEPEPNPDSGSVTTTQVTQSERDSSNAQKRPKSACLAAGGNV